MILKTPREERICGNIGFHKIEGSSGQTLGSERPTTNSRWRNLSTSIAQLRHILSLSLFESVTKNRSMSCHCDRPLIDSKRCNGRVAERPCRNWSPRPISGFLSSKFFLSFRVKGWGVVTRLLVPSAYLIGREDEQTFSATDISDNSLVLVCTNHIRQTNFILRQFR
jgi:hypothetical protein